MSGISLKSPTVRGIALIALCAAISFGVSVGGDFVWDDQLVLVNNPVYRDFDLGSMLFSLGNQHKYQPIRDLSTAIDYQLYSGKPWGFHLSSVLIHIFVSSVAFLLARRIAVELLGLVDEKHKDLPLIVGLLYASHPLMVEPVAFITARNVLLAGGLFLLAAYIFAGAAAKGEGAAGRYAASMGVALLAFLSKETSVILAGALLVVALHAKDRRAFLWTLPFFAMSGIFFIVYKAVATKSGFITTKNMMVFGAQTISSKLAVALQIPFFYIWKTIWPVGLNPSYDDFFSRQLLSPEALLGLGGLLALLGAAAFCYRAHRAVTFGILWYLVCLAPVLNFFLTSPVVADRYMYIPAFGLFMVAGYAVSLVPGRRRAVAAVVIIICMVLSVKQSSTWLSEIALWSHAAKYERNKITAQENLVTALWDADRRDEAMNVALDVERRIPGAFIASRFKAKGMIDLGRYDEAIELLLAMSEMGPLSAKDQYLLGLAYEGAGKAIEALDTYASVQRTPGADFNNYKGVAAERSARLRGAIMPEIEAIRASVKANPGNLGLMSKLAYKLDTAAMGPEAIEVYMAMLERGGPHWGVYYNIAIIYRKMGILDKAIENFRRSMELNPSNVDTPNLLGSAYAESGMMAEAEAEYKKAVAMGSPQAAFNLGRMYFSAGREQDAREYFGRAVAMDPSIETLADSYLILLK